MRRIVGLIVPLGVLTLICMACTKEQTRIGFRTHCTTVDKDLDGDGYNEYVDLTVNVDYIEDVTVSYDRITLSWETEKVLESDTLPIAYTRKNINMLYDSTYKLNITGKWSGSMKGSHSDDVIIWVIDSTMYYTEVERTFDITIQ